LNFDSIIPAGHHVLEILGGEGCCDGGSRFEFNVDGEGFKPITV